MAQPIAPDYGQQFPFPSALEDWVAADHPARFLREFVDQLDLAAMGTNLVMETKGQNTPQHEPKRRYLDGWVKAVNEHGGFGKWKAGVCLNPSDLPTVIHETAKGLP